MQDGTNICRTLREQGKEWLMSTSAPSKDLEKHGMVWTKLSPGPVTVDMQVGHKSRFAWGSSHLLLFSLCNY